MAFAVSYNLNSSLVSLGALSLWFFCNTLRQAATAIKPIQDCSELQQLQMHVHMYKHVKKIYNGLLFWWVSISEQRWRTVEKHSWSNTKKGIDRWASVIIVEFFLKLLQVFLVLVMLAMVFGLHMLHKVDNTLHYLGFREIVHSADE